MIVTVCHEGGQTDGRMDGRTERETDRQTDGQRDTNSYRVALRILKSSFNFSKTTSSPVVTVNRSLICRWHLTLISLLDSHTWLSLIMHSVSFTNVIMQCIYSKIMFLFHHNYTTDIA